MKKWTLVLSLVTALISVRVFADLKLSETGVWEPVLTHLFDNSSGGATCSDFIPIVNGPPSTKEKLWLWRDGYFAARNETLGLKIQADNTWSLRVEIFCAENPEISVRESISKLYKFYMDKKQNSD